MYEYRNVKTGEIVVTSSRVSGENWVPVEPAQTEQENQEPEQPRQRRKKE